MDIREQYAQGKISAYAVLDELDAKTERIRELESRVTELELATSRRRLVAFGDPYLKNRADGVDGHYCIARNDKKGYHEFWNDKIKKWASAASVFELGKSQSN